MYFYSLAMKTGYEEKTKKNTQTEQIVPDKSMAGTHKLLRRVTPPQQIDVFICTKKAWWTGLFYGLSFLTIKTESLLVIKKKPQFQLHEDESVVSPVFLLIF
jgi:hypothetical protein